LEYQQSLNTLVLIDLTRRVMAKWGCLTVQRGAGGRLAPVFGKKYAELTPVGAV
jgi:hypothetical protein